MQSNRVWARVAGVETGVVIERVDVDDLAGEITVSCRLRRRTARRCGRCLQRCSGYDSGEGVGGHEILPIGGHETARWWSTVLPTGGQWFCPR